MTETILIIFVGVSAAALVVQGLALERASRAIRQSVEHFSRRSRQLEADFEELMASLGQVLEGLRPLGEVSREVNSQVAQMTGMVRKRAEDVDQFVGEIVEMGREQAAKIDFVVSDTVRKFEQATDLIQKDVIAPVSQLSSLLKGIRAGIAYLVNHRGRASASGDDGAQHADDEMFI